MASFTASISHSESIVIASCTTGYIKVLRNCEWPRPSAWPISCLVKCSNIVWFKFSPLDIFEIEISTLSINPLLSK